MALVVNNASRCVHERRGTMDRLNDLPLAELGIKYAQGFYFAEPAAAEGWVRAA